MTAQACTIKGVADMQDTILTHERLATVEQELKSVNRRLNNLEKLVDSVHIMATELKAMRDDLNDITDKVEDIEHKPIKRYETIVTAILTAVCGGVVGYLLSIILH